MDKQPKPVDMLIIHGIKIDGVHYDADTIVEGMKPELAIELGGQGRARLATAEDAKRIAAKAKKAA